MSRRTYSVTDSNNRSNNRIIKTSNNIIKVVLPVNKATSIAHDWRQRITNDAGGQITPSLTDNPIR